MTTPERISNPPDAASLMTTARSFGNYDLAGALADLIDNSIKAKSQNIEITCLFLDDGDCEVRIRDDGEGMSGPELKKAMRPASANPAEERSPDDLGRFGWGMKSASFSQAKILTVVTAIDGTLNAARWDIDNIENWAMTVFDNDGAIELLNEPFSETSGTELIWTNCDRLSENRSISQEQFNTLVVQARQKLSLIFHRYLAGDTRDKIRLIISINGTKLDAIDPFCRSNHATIPFDPETITVPGAHDNSQITMQAFTLPHYSKLSESEYNVNGGEEGYLRNQGFYVYRSHRLIIWGTWFLLAKHGELSKLVRIMVDIPNTLDDMWKITVDKSDAQLPAILKKRMKALIDKFRNSSAKVFRSKGAKIDKTGKDSVWERTVRKQAVRYRINRAHPLIRSLRAKISNEDQSKENTIGFDTMLDMVEAEIPLESINHEVAANPYNIQQRDVERDKFKEFAKCSIPVMMAKYQSPGELVEALKNAEPYASNWQVVEEVLQGMKLL